MIAQNDRERLTAVLEAMLRRPRLLPAQTLRHLEDHLDSTDDNVAAFLRVAASQLEEYELDILLAPAFTPSFEEQVEVATPLRAYRPAAGDIPAIVAELLERVATCPVVLPGNELADLTLHEVLVSRWVALLRLEHAPPTEVASSIEEVLPAELVAVALANVRRKGFTQGHQEWFARFVPFAVDRHAVDRESLDVLADFLASQPSLDQEELQDRLESLLKASVEAGTFAQKGRMYWSSDVAEHHQFRGQGVVDEQDVEKRMREIDVLETLRSDLRAFGDVLG